MNLGLCLILIGTLPAWAQELPIKTESFKRGSELADQYCAVCHMRPQPEQLDKKTWREKVMPAVKKRVGMDALDPNGTPEERQALAEWRTIWEDYILLAAPETALPQGPRAPIQTTLAERFEIEEPKFQSEQGYATLVHIDSAARQLYLGSAFDRSLKVLDSQGTLLSSCPVDSTVVDLLRRPNGWMATEIGKVIPDDRPLGRISFLTKTGNTFDKPTTVLPRLIRPVNCQLDDLDADGRLDIAVASFGNILGRFCWYPNLGGGGFAEETLFDRPGAVRVLLHDYNRDGRNDMFVLMAQAREGLYLFTNQGDGRFEPRPLIERPPVWGYTYFDLVDFNADGFPDILTTNGDLGDFVSCTRKYHGIRIHLNDGKYNFRETFFYPLNGVSKAIARDYDEDGHLDLAAISFFPDYRKSPEESFVYLQNEGSLRFKALTFPNSWRGRWMVMDAGDLDGDGDIDIVLGAAYHFAARGLPAMIDRWKQEGPSLMILRNRLKSDAPE